MAEQVQDRAGLEILSRQECLELLASQPVGRLAFVIQGVPEILPVTHAVQADAVVFRAGPGSKLGAAARADVVAFEVDHFDPLTRSGWSVVVHGTAELVVDKDDLERLYTTDVVPWAWNGGTAVEWVRIVLIDVSGRRTVRH